MQRVIFLIKGVNRQIIEITETGSMYYERAILVVKPQFVSASTELLKREARIVVNGAKAPSAFSIKREKRIKLCTMLAVAALSAALTLVMTLNILGIIG